MTGKAAMGGALKHRRGAAARRMKTAAHGTAARTAARTAIVELIQTSSRGPRASGLTGKFWQTERATRKRAHRQDRETRTGRAQAGAQVRSRKPDGPRASGFTSNSERKGEACEPVFLNIGPRARGPVFCPAYPDQIVATAAAAGKGAYMEQGVGFFCRLYLKGNMAPAQGFSGNYLK